MRLNGRTDRKNLIISVLLSGITLGIIEGIVGAIDSNDKTINDILIIISGILAVIYVFPIWIRRFHDLGQSAILLAGFIIPGINLLVVIYAVVWPGQSSKNKYGEKPDGRLDIIREFFGK